MTPNDTETCDPGAAGVDRECPKCGAEWIGTLMRPRAHDAEADPPGYGMYLCATTVDEDGVHQSPRCKDNQIADLEAIVEKLPKCWRLCADGSLVQDVPATLGKHVWEVVGEHIGEHTITGYELREVEGNAMWTVFFPVGFSKLWRWNRVCDSLEAARALAAQTTRKAALAAADEGEQPNCVTNNAPFDEIKHLLSDKPLRTRCDTCPLVLAEEDRIDLAALEDREDEPEIPWEEARKELGLSPSGEILKDGTTTEAP